MPAIAQTFGNHMVGPDGAMDRDAMRALIFKNPQAKRLLENIIHPLVSVLSQELAQTAMRHGQTVLVFDVPLLVESGARWRSQLDRVLVVDCEAQTQRQRVLQRSGLSHEDSDRIMAQQASRAQRLACADIVIVNEGLNFDGLERLTGLVAADFGL
jgi:dephospho-CoA kinase